MAGRVDKLKKNIFYGTFSNVVIMILSFVSRTVFIHNLSKAELGVNGVFSNVLTILSFAELGIGTAMNYSLYSLVANKETEKIKSLMAFYRKAYTVIAMIVGVMGLAVAPFLHVFKGIDGVKNLYPIYFLYLFNTVASYFVSYKYSLSNAEQKNYIFTNINLIFNIVCTCTQIAVVLLFKNFLIYCIVGAVVQLIQNITTTIYMNKLYPFLKDKNVEKVSKEDLAPVIKNVKALIISKIGSILVNQTDNIIMAVVVDTIAVGLVSNYLTLTRNVSQFLNIVFNSATAGFGNLIATESKQKQYETFKCFRFLAFWSYGFASVALFVLMSPFVVIWCGKSYTTTFAVVLWLCINYYFGGHRICVYNVKVAGGLFEQDKWLAFATAIVNLVVSIIGAMIWGVAGIYFGTFMQGILETVVRPRIIYKHLFGVSSKEYFKEGAGYLVSVVIAGAVCYAISRMTMSTVTVKAFIFNMVSVTVITNAWFYALYRKRPEFDYLKKVVLGRLGKFKIFSKFA